MNKSKRMELKKKLIKVTLINSDNDYMEVELDDSVLGAGVIIRKESSQEGNDRVFRYEGKPSFCMRENHVFREVPVLYLDLELPDEEE